MSRHCPQVAVKSEYGGSELLWTDAHVNEERGFLEHSFAGPGKEKKNLFLGLSPK